MNLLTIIFASHLPSMLGMTLFDNLAALFKNLDTLIQENSDFLTTTDKNGDMMLHHFISYKSVNSAKKLMKPKYGLDWQNISGLSPMHLAVMAESVELVAELKKVKADPTLRTNEHCGSKTPLHYAAERGLHEITELLIQGGAEVDAMDKDNYTAMHIAAKHGFVKVVQVLLQYGAKKNIDSSGRTPLHEAALSGAVLVVRELLSYEDVDKEKEGRLEDCHVVHRYRNKYLRTPLQMAVEKLHVEVVGTLLDKGANPNKCVDELQRSALFFLAKDVPETSTSGTTEVSRLDKGKGLQSEEEMTRLKMKLILDLLLHYKADAKIENSLSYNVLEYAIIKNFVFTFEILLEKIKEEVGSGSQGDWSKVLESDGKKSEHSRSVHFSREDRPNMNNALELSLMDLNSMNPRIAFPLIVLEAQRKRSHFVLTEDQASCVLRHLLDDKLDMLANKEKNMRRETFSEFWDFALDDFLGTEKVEIKDIFTKYMQYKKSNVYIFYLALKHYYPRYKRNYTSGDNIHSGITDVAEFEKIAVLPYKMKIEAHVQEIVSRMSPIRRVDLEEKFVLLSLVIREAQCKFQEAARAVQRAIKTV